MREADVSISDIVARIPDADDLRKRLARNLQERTLIRKLLKLAEQRAKLTAAREVSHAQ